jgi:hypothetical protein
MAIPSPEGFNPNVSVQIQAYDGSLKEYANLSREQFEAIEVTILSESIADSLIIWEYTGSFQDRALRFYSKAVLGDNIVYLVTATALQSQWSQHGASLKNCVDSFVRE